MDSLQAFVIDDSKAMRLILGRMLRDLGFDVAEAVDGRDALEQLSEGLSPELILVDWNMPEMSGIDFVEAVRKPPFTSRARVLMVTTETELAQVVRALDSGVDEYVMKPFTKDTILEKLQLMGLDI
jgi:two-component system chemotaxis response regulator CheY